MFFRQLFILFFCCFSGSLLAQLTPAQFDLYTTSNGLSHNYITGLAQDSTGYVWITTQSGLNRFNGSSYAQFHSTNDNLSIASEDLKGATWLSKNLLGISTSGLHIVNTRTGRTHNLFIPYHRKQFEYKFNMTERVLGDEGGNIYVLTRSGFYHFDSQEKLVSRFDYYDEKDVPVAHFFFGRELIELDQTKLLVVSVDGLYLYNKKFKQLKKMAEGDYPLADEFLDYQSKNYLFLPHKPGSFFVLKSLTDTIVYVNQHENKKTYSKLPLDPVSAEISYYSKLRQANDTLFYITGQNTCFYKMRFYPETGAVKLHPEKYFADYQCTALLTDNKQQLWVGTTRGLFHYNETRSSIRLARIPQSVETAYPNIAIGRVLVSGNKLFAGTRSVGSVLVYDKNELRYADATTFDAYRKKTGKSMNVYSMVESDANTVMLATNGPPLLIKVANNNPRFLFPPLWNEKHDWAGELFRDSKGIVWISSGRIHLYDPVRKQFQTIPDKVLSETQIRQPESIREDAAGNIWMAGHGLSRYNVSTGRFDLNLDSFPFIKMPDKQVSMMEIDKKRNTIWFNSYNNGLISYNISNGTFRHFTTAHNLPANNISSLTIINDYLWMAAGSAIVCMNLATSQIRSFGKEDGFPDMPVLNRSNFVFDTSSRLIYIGFSKAIAVFDPAQLLREKSPPHVFIEELTTNDTNTIYQPGSGFTTSWKENEIRISIGTINFSDASTQRFAYRIYKDSNSPWIETGSQPTFSISNLSPGEYKIQVKCSSAGNRWPEQVKDFKLTVTPPVWQESWAIFMMIALALALVYWLIRWRTNVVKRREMIKTQIEKLKANDYKNQFELEQITNYFSSSLADKKTEEDVLWDVSKNLIGRMNYEECIIYLWNADKTRMVQKAAYGPKGKPELITTNVFEVAEGQGVVGHVIKTRQPELINDTRKDSRYRVDDEFRLSEITVPIIHNNELLGVIDSEHRKAHYFSERDIKILTTIATLLGNKLKQIESQQSLEAKQKELAGINEQLAEARLSALQAQMNPHFVFNALNSIKRMILENDNEKASRYLSKFALMIRMTLDHSRQIFVTLDDNIAYIKAYLEMEQLRFDDSFTYHICIDEDLDTTETSIPSMMIQPLVENAIWHGLMQAEGNKKIKICFGQSENQVVCTIQDNGIGIRHAEQLKEKQRPLHRSAGLENLKNRIKIMNEKYDLNCSLDIKDLSDAGENQKGTKVILRFNSINT